MSWMNYAKSFLTTSNSQTPHIYRWVSILILFVDDGRTVLHKGYIFLGDISVSQLSYINFANFNVIGNDTFYMNKNGTTKYIDSTKIYLHVKFGHGPFAVAEENINYWNVYFSSPTNKIYKSISNDLNKERVKLINMTNHIPSKKRLTATNISHPLFSYKQIYGLQMDQVILSDIHF